MRRNTVAVAVSVLLAGCALSPAKPPPPSTVARVTEHGGPGDNWVLNKVIVNVPSLVRLQPSEPIPADADGAIEHYDRVLQWTDDPMLRAEAQRRAADLRLRRADAGEAGPDALASAIAAYESILAEVPDYPRRDRVRYQLARAYQLAGDNDRSIEQLLRLGAERPDSERAADGLFRAAELLYAQNRYDEAEPAYRKVVALGEQTPFFAIAQYKHGWTLFHQADYDGAVAEFFALLDRTLPSRTDADVAAAIAGAQGPGAEFTADALRVVGLSFAALGGGQAINRRFERDGDPRFATLIYLALGDLLLDKRRFTDAAQTYEAYTARYPDDPRAPTFQRKVIAAYDEGGFGELALAAREDYAERYAPDRPYWRSADGTRTPPDALLADLRQTFGELGRHYQAQGQAMRSPESDATAAVDAAQREKLLLKAAYWYERQLAVFPEADTLAATHVLAGDALFDAGRYQRAADHYAHAGYDDPAAAPAADAAYAAIQAHQRLAQAATTDDARRAARTRSVEWALKFAEVHASDARAPKAMARAAVELYELQDYPQAIAVAERVLQLEPEASLRQAAVGVIAEAQFAAGNFVEAEAAYVALLEMLPPSAEDRPQLSERLAASIYRQAETARERGDTLAAAALFERVGQRAPGASIRATADYDAAAALIAAEQWAHAAEVLEGFRQRYPRHELIAEVDKKLAVTYDKREMPEQAAAVYARIARRDGEAADVRRSAAWLTAELYDGAGRTHYAADAYAYYVDVYAEPLERAQRARRRLADIAEERRDEAQRLRWLDAIVVADQRDAGRADADARKMSKAMTAQARLEIGRVYAESAQRVALTAPIQKSLPRRKAATEQAIDAFEKAAAAGYAEITTAATYELASLYRDLGQALLKSERPRGLDALALEQYELLLEEQAFPFEEQAIDVYGANVERIRQGLWNDWILRSVHALAEIAPAQYGKNEHREVIYESPL